MTPNNPSIDPALQDTLVGAFNFVLNKSLQITDDMLWARVIAYKPGNPPYVQVQPMIQIITTGGQLQSRPQYAEIPVLVLGGGGFVINFPLNTGDFGLIKANDRDTSLFLQYLKESPPNTERMHSFSDAVFIPSVLLNYTVSSSDSANLVIQNLAGTSKVSIGASKVTIAAPAVEIDALLTTINGNLLVNGNIVATGTITPGGEA